MWVARQGSTDLERAEIQLREMRDDLDAVLDDVSAMLDALESAWAVEPSDPVRDKLDDAVRAAVVPVARRLRR